MSDPYRKPLKIRSKRDSCAVRSDLHQLGAEAHGEALAEHRRLIREACAAGVASTAHGGQVVLPEATAKLAGVEPTSLGSHRLNTSQCLSSSTSWAITPFRL
jgi:hypothetical protein